MKMHWARWIYFRSRIGLAQV